MRKRKRWFLAGAILFVAAAGSIGFIILKANESCIGTYANISFRYTCSWRKQVVRFKLGSTGVLLTSPHKQIAVGISKPYPIQNPGTDGLVETWEVIHSQVQKNLPDTIDARIVFEDKTNFYVIFTPVELLIPAATYKELGLRPYHMVAENPDYNPQFFAGGRGIGMIGNSQTFFRSLGRAKSWFQNPNAQAEHQIFLSIALTHS